MNEDGFRQRYRAMQAEVKAPADLIESARKAAHEIERQMDARTRTMPAIPESTARMRRPRREHGRILRAALPAAACLALALAVFGAVSLAPPSAEQPALFTIKAYASGADAALEPPSEDIVAFVLDETTSAGNQSYHRSGVYTGMCFTVEGDGIEWVQATPPGGELYTCTAEEIIRRDDPEKLSEALSWKPTYRGRGSALAGYDWVSVVAVDDGRNHADDEKAHQLRLLKLLGSTIDIEVSPDEPLRLGLWFPDAGFDASGRLDLSSLSGQMLTVTACFADGRQQTRTIELADGWFATEELPYAPQSGIDRRPVGAPLSETEAQSVDGAYHTLYGKVTSTEEEGHPFPLDAANEHADEPVAAEALDVPSYGSTAQAAAPDPEHVHTGEGAVRFQALAGTEPYDALDLHSFSVEDVTAYAADRLPNGYDPAQDTRAAAFSGDVGYMNAYPGNANGWQITADGTIGDGDSFIIIDMDVTNRSSEALYLHPSHLGGICALDAHADSATYALAGVFAATNGDERAYPWIGAAFAPGETRHIQLVYIADDVVARADKVTFTTALIEPHGISERMLGSAEYVMLGKLERR